MCTLEARGWVATHVHSYEESVYILEGEAELSTSEGVFKLRAGDYAGALPLLQSAVQKLSGTAPGDPYEAYANYNLGYTLLQLGRCDEAAGYLKTAQRLEPGRSEPRDAAKRAKDCAKG